VRISASGDVNKLRSKPIDWRKWTVTLGFGDVGFGLGVYQLLSAT